MTRVLITGGAGFIGSFVTDELLSAGHEVRILDALDPQVHEGGRIPDYLHPGAEFVHADVRDAEALDRALAGVDAVVHLAAAVGVGQSMYEVRRYVDVNAGGTAVLMEALGRRPVGRLVVASSMSLYGEGACIDEDGRPATPLPRSREAVAARKWEPTDGDGRTLSPVPTDEDQCPRPASPYALTKYDQEILCLALGAAYGIPTLALRLFNVYGPRQALSNPYTGVLAIFAARLLNGQPPMIFEDGQQRRDFVSVRDVARAFHAALRRPDVSGCALNIGSGQSCSIAEVARRLACVLGRAELEPEVTGRCRAGDIRHCFADISRATGRLGWRPQVRFDEGLEELAAWLRDQTPEDRVAHAAEELARRGLTL